MLRNRYFLLIGKNLPKTLCNSSYALTKTPQKPRKNFMPQKAPTKTFNESLTKIPIKILNNNKKTLILPNNSKTHEPT